jgi:DNA-binding response OmpR family regulator
MSNIDYNNKHFLIIDNIKPSHDVLKRFAMSLTTKQVDSTYYAQDAIPFCLERQYDVIFLGYDLGEKQKNGQQLLEELRISEVISRHCVVVMITAEVSQAMVLAALEHKPDSYLCKPYTVSELGKRLDSCIRKKNAMTGIYEALENEDKKLAISLASEAVTNKTPYKSECLGIISRQLFELQEFGQAKEIYSAYQNEKNCTWASIGLGKIALQENELTDAESIFRKVIEDKPLYLPGYDWLASTYEKKYSLLSAEETLEQALKLSPRSLLRLKKFAGLCFENKHFEKATDAYGQVHDLALNSIHHKAENALLYAKSLANYSSEIPLIDAKKLNNKAFSMLSQVNKSFNQPEVRIQSHLLSACLLENIHDYIVAKDKLDLGLKLLDKEQYNIDSESLKNIATSLTKLNRNGKASQILISANKQQSEQALPSGKIGELSNSQLNESYAVKAQRALTKGKELYESKYYDESIKSLTHALQLFPNHNGIKLNLLHTLLGTYESDRNRIDELKQAKNIILGLMNISKNNEDYSRFRKIKRKYQQLTFEE